jgi:pimeloyl-ACP methyl ester carboxylesterase
VTVALTGPAKVIHNLFPSACLATGRPPGRKIQAASRGTGVGLKANVLYETNLTPREIVFDLPHLDDSTHVIAPDLEIEKVSMIGHDRGARVATRFAKDHPAMLDQLVVMETFRHASFFRA